MANLNNGPVCINHHNRPAVAHCASCRRPICEECLVEQDGFKCCSKECLQQALASTAISNDILSHRGRANAKAKFAGFIKWIVILAVLAGLWFSGLGKKGWNWVVEKFNSGKAVVEEKAKEGVLKDKARRDGKRKQIDDFSDPSK